MPSSLDAKTPSLDMVAEATVERYGAGRFAPRNADELDKLAHRWYYSELLPESYYPPLLTEKNPKGYPYQARWEPRWSKRGISRAVIVMRYGASLGVLPEQSLRSIYIVEGQPSPSAQLMLALCLSNGFLRRDDYEMEVSATKTTIRLFTSTRPNKPEIITAEYSEYSGLHNKNVWKNHTKDMLVARAISRMVRRYFPDVFCGVYCAEERLDMGPDTPEADMVVEKILASAEMPGEAPPVEEPTDIAPGSLAEQEQLIREVEAAIEALPQGAAAGDPAVKSIEEKGLRIQGSERTRLGALLRAKVPRA